MNWPQYSQQEETGVPKEDFGAVRKSGLVPDVAAHPPHDLVVPGPGPAPTINPVPPSPFMRTEVLRVIHPGEVSSTTTTSDDPKKGDKYHDKDGVFRGGFGD